jgi:hypothetical protein
MTDKKYIVKQKMDPFHSSTNSTWYYGVPDIEFRKRTPLRSTCTHVRYVSRKSTPDAGIEPATTRLRVVRSTD